MSKKSNHKRKGIYSSESRECGCEIRRYSGGKIITIGCQNHHNITEYVCPICEKKHKNYQLLKECRWTHAVT